MAKLKVNTNRRAKVVFTERSLARFSIDAMASAFGSKIFVDFAMPYITFRHNDRKSAEDVIQGLKLIVRWADKLQKKDSRFFVSVEKPTLIVDRFTVRVFPSFENPVVQAIKEESGYWRWNFEGHYFNNDIPSAVRYLCCIQKLVDSVYEARK